MNKKHKKIKLTPVFHKSDSEKASVCVSRCSVSISKTKLFQLRAASQTCSSQSHLSSYQISDEDEEASSLLRLERSAGLS